MFKVIARTGVYGCLTPTLIMILFPVLFPFYCVIIAAVFFIRLVKSIYKYFVGEPIKVANELNKLDDIVREELKGNPRPNRTPDFMITYKGGMIEIYQRERIYRVLDDNAVDIGKNYKSLEEAKKIIEDYL